MSVSVLGQAPPWAASCLAGPSWGRGSHGSGQASLSFQDSGHTWQPGPGLLSPALLSLRQTLGRAHRLTPLLSVLTTSGLHLANLQQTIDKLLEFANIREWREAATNIRGQ